MIPNGHEQASPAAMPARVRLRPAGVYPLLAGVRVSPAGGKPKITDGPFAESKEVIGG